MATNMNGMNPEDTQDFLFISKREGMYIVIIFPINISKGREDQTSCFGGGVCLVLEIVMHPECDAWQGAWRNRRTGWNTAQSKKLMALQDEVFCKASRMGNWSG